LGTKIADAKCNNTLIAQPVVRVARSTVASLLRRPLGQCRAAHGRSQPALSLRPGRRQPPCAEQGTPAGRNGRPGDQVISVLRYARTSRTSWSVCTAGTTRAEGERNAPVP
jgi:hypothetical protein